MTRARDCVAPALTAGALSAGFTWVGAPHPVLAGPGLVAGTTALVAGMRMLRAEARLRARADQMEQQ